MHICLCKHWLFKG